jgi:hypothetical protein
MYINVDILQMHSFQMGSGENVTEDFDVNPTELANRNKSLIIGDFSAQVGNDVIIVGQEKW